MAGRSSSETGAWMIHQRPVYGKSSIVEPGAKVLAAARLRSSPGLVLGASTLSCGLSMRRMVDAQGEMGKSPTDVVLKASGRAFKRPRRSDNGDYEVLTHWVIAWP